MPNLEMEITKVQGFKYYANVDFSQGHCQLPVSNLTGFPIILNTTWCLFYYTCASGYNKCNCNLQSAFSSEILEELLPYAIRWLEDIFLYAYRLPKLLTGIELLVRLCIRMNFRLHPDKGILVATQMRWFDRIIDASGWHYDLPNSDSVQLLQTPTPGVNLQQFRSVMNWMRMAIPNFSKLISPLQAFLENVYYKAEKRSKCSIARIQL